MLQGLPGHPTWQTAVAFSPDGQSLVAFGEDGYLKVWCADDPRAPAPEIAEARRLTWHLRQAEDSEEVKHWFAAAFHLDRLLEARPQQRQWLARCGRAHVELGRWQQAADVYARALALDARDLSVAYRHALLCLRAGDREGYRRACAGLLESVGPTPDAATANTVAWACALAPGAADAARMVSLAERAVATDPNSRRFLNTLAAALYRAGRFAEALEKLTAAVQAHGRGGVPEDWLFLAMAQHRLGRAAEARQWLAKAARSLDRAAEAPPPEDATLPWNRRLEGELLRREAEELLRGAEADR